jgi:hypothetical protein
VSTTFLDRVPADEITARARAARPGRTLLTLLAGALFGAAWLAGKTFAVLWLGAVWCWAAIDMGWKASHGNQPSRASLREENDRLRKQITRMGG